MSAFTTQFTTRVGRDDKCHAVIADSYEGSIHDLAQILSTQLGENERPAFVANVLQECRKILPAQESGEEPTDEQRLQCLKLLSSDITKAALSAASQSELEGFVNLYLSLATPFAQQLDELNSHIDLFISALASPSALTTLLYILPPSANESARLHIYEKLVQSGSNEQRKPILDAFINEIPTWSMNTQDKDASILGMTQTFIRKGDYPTAEQLLARYNSDNQEIQRLRLRLALHSPTCFSFPSAPDSPESDIVEYVVSSTNLDESSLKTGIPQLNKHALQSKKTSLAIAKLFSTRIGHKLGYKTISQEVLSSATDGDADIDEAVESAVIDAIKSKLVQARLSQPSRSVTVVSSAYHSLLASLPQSAALGSKEDREKEQWSIIQKRLQGLRTNMDTLTSGLDSVVGSNSAKGASQQENADPSAEKVATNLLDRAGGLVDAGKPVEVA